MSETTSEAATVEETETTDTSADTSADTDVDAPIEGEEALGDPGKKALDRMKEEKKAAIADATALRKEIDRMKAEAELKGKPPEEQALEAAKAEARAEATAKANERILRSELRAAATGKLADPTDAALYIDLSSFEVGDEGDVDSDALNDAITQLIELKPHLAAGKPARFDGGADQGAQGKNATPPQWTEADLTRHKGNPDAITEAKAKGLLNNLLGIT